MPKPTSTWRRSPEALAVAFGQALPTGARVEKRQMFGYPAAFVNGNMAAGLHQEQIIVRLPERERKALLAKPGARTFEAMPGRPMVEYVVVPPALVAKAVSLRGWIAKAVAHAASLPPKVKKARPPAAPIGAAVKPEGQDRGQGKDKSKRGPRRGAG
jgi:TfoX/Sxy family transcriptional regulator of competence genes